MVSENHSLLNPLTQQGDSRRALARIGQRRFVYKRHRRRLVLLQLVEDLRCYRAATRHIRPFADLHVGQIVKRQGHRALRRLTMRRGRQEQQNDQTRPLHQTSPRFRSLLSEWHNNRPIAPLKLGNSSPAERTGLVHCGARCCSACGMNSPSVARTCRSLPSRLTVNVTSVPGAVPAIKFRNELGSLTSVALREVITSPLLSPARSAPLPAS